jgi:hypothetical protein
MVRATFLGALYIGHGSESTLPPVGKGEWNRSGLCELANAF